MMSARDRWARRGAYLATGPALSAAQLTWLDELLVDADKSHRPTPWERTFLASVASERKRGGDRLSLTGAQLDVLRGIERKIHAIG